MKYIKEPEKQIPVLSEYDTFVAGGGIAGISAALAAARNGAKVLITNASFCSAVLQR